MNLTAHENQRRAFYLSAVSTTLLTQAATIPFGSLIVVTFNPPMPVWFWSYYALIFVASFPVGLFAACFGRWLRRFVVRSPIALILVSLGMAFVTCATIRYLKDVSMPAWVELPLLLIWTSCAPFFMGAALYLFLCRVPSQSGQGERTSTG